LSHHVGVSRALEITMTNRRVGATECADLGLCHEVVADERVVSAAVELAATLADMVPDSLVTTRKLVHGAAAMAFLDAIAAERDQQERLGMTPEHKEGVRAFLEKRKADFRSPST
jgi:2-(1,2-epoxy-1,2-dihydrophenyl)acetyl-CoA isomerase